ncbi:MAG: hypothetical protein JWM16_3659 [Verrucomicrobiales bacterium]|nr:hypothetical protein [Verrucomicrobiales bacterium]
MAAAHGNYVAVAQDDFADQLAVNSGNGVGLNRKEEAVCIMNQNAEVLLPNALLFDPEITCRRSADCKRKMADVTMSARHFTC